MWVTDQKKSSNSINNVNSQNRFSKRKSKVYSFSLLSFFSELLFLPDMEFCETPHILCSGYQADLHGVAEHSYPLEVGSDVDTETEGAASPDHALRMWMRGMKSEHSSCLSSRANSALSLTDTDHERKSDGENGNKEMHLIDWIEIVIYFTLSSSTYL